MLSIALQTFLGFSVKAKVIDLLVLRLTEEQGHGEESVSCMRSLRRGYGMFLFPQPGFPSLSHNLHVV